MDGILIILVRMPKMLRWTTTSIGKFMHQTKLSFLLLIVCGVPVHITPIFGLENRVYTSLYAYFLYPFTAIALTGSIYMTMAITIERFMAVCHPHYYRDLNTRVTPLRRVLMYALPVTTFAVTVNIPKFLETQVSSLIIQP